MEIIQGIYKISNSKNGKVYIGQSVHIYRRWADHLRSALKDRQDSNYPIHKAMREIGVENFFVEVIERVENREDLNEREIFWIRELEGQTKGYNVSKGGTSVQGENNPRARLTEEDVENIRTLYDRRVPFREVLRLYEGVISKRGLQKVWHHETWLKIMPEVYTEENKRYHATMAKGFIQPKKSNTQKKLPEEEIQKIRELHKEGTPFTQIAKSMGRTPSTIRKYALELEAKAPQSGNRVKNIETDKIFESFKQAAKWAGCDRHTISNFIKGKSRYGCAGVVPETGQRATWTTDF